MNGSAWLLPLLVTTVARATPETYPCQNGLVRSLVAREPMFMNPLAVAVDSDGAIYVTETTRRKQADLDIRETMDWVADDLSLFSVEWKSKFLHKSVTDWSFKKHPSLKDHNQDGHIDWQDLTVHSERIHKLVDTDGDGIADKATIFSEGFNTEVTGIAGGVFADHGDIYAGIAPDLWTLRDTDGDGKADERKAIATGFGVHVGYAGHDMHGLTPGPDGKLYWTTGDKGLHIIAKTPVTSIPHHYPHEGALLRCNANGSDFEVVARGLRNVQQIAFDDYGNIFGVDSSSGQDGEKARLLYIVEGSDSGWRYYYQYRSGNYNPWMNERIAFPDEPDRPASILPPLVLDLKASTDGIDDPDGPGGFTYNPGTALNERYRGHFFLSGFPAGKVHAFKLEPDGAAYRMTGAHLVAGGTAFTGCNFGPDGALYVTDWQGSDPLKQKKGALWKIDDPKEAGTALRKEVAAMLKEGAARLTDAELLKRLGHPDQRLRLDAQWELAARDKWDELRIVAASSTAPQLARIHALWGLSQGKKFYLGLFDSLATDEDPEIRAQAAKWSACAYPPVASDYFVRLLADPSPRVRFHTAMAAPTSSSPAVLKGVLAMLEENNNRDRFLSHAGSIAIGRCRFEDLKALAHHPSIPVRLATLTALGRILDGDARRKFAVLIEPELQPFCGTDDEARAQLEVDFDTLAESFLNDSSPAVTAEAAWVCYDMGFASVATLLDRKIELPSPAIRRAIASNRRIRSEESLLRLAKYAADPNHDLPMRILALETLARVDSDEPLNEVTGEPGRRTPDLKGPILRNQELCRKLDEILSPLTREAQLSQAASAAIRATGVNASR